MTSARIVLGIVAALAASCGTSVGQDTGAWRIEAATNFVSLSTAAIDNGTASLTLRCRPDISLYEFVLRDPRLARLPSAAEVSMAVRHPRQEAARFMAVARGDGSVLAQERIHQAAFSSILALVTAGDVDTVELAISDEQWAFRLQGFAAALAALTAQCGFAPDPMRARRK
jgi:hypothetical protein